MGKVRVFLAMYTQTQGNTYDVPSRRHLEPKRGQAMVPR